MGVRCTGTRSSLWSVGDSPHHRRLFSHSFICSVNEAQTTSRYSSCIGVLTRQSGNARSAWEELVKLNSRLCHQNAIRSLSNLPGTGTLVPVVPHPTKMTCEDHLPVSLPEPSPNNCQCRIEDAPLFCERHGVQKGRRWVELCQRGDNYWQAWEESRGPGQGGGTRTRQHPPRPRHGPGDELSRMLSWIGLKYMRNCKCSARASQMNKWGPDKCLEEIETILGWLEQEAGKRKLPFVKPAARAMVKLAIRRSRKKLAKE